MTIRRITWIAVLCAFAGLMILSTSQAATTWTVDPVAGNTSLRLTWSGVSGGSPYTLNAYRWTTVNQYSSTNPTGTPGTAELPGFSATGYTGTTYTKTGMGSNYKWTWSVTGNGSSSPEYSTAIYTSQKTPTSVAFSNITASGFTSTAVQAAGGWANLNWDQSGIQFNVKRTGSTGAGTTTKVGADSLATTGVRSNTQFTVKALAVNGNNLSTAYSGDYNVWTLANAAFAASGNDAVNCDKGLTGGDFLLGTTFAFDAVNGFGISSVTGGATRANSYKYFWDNNSVAPVDWTAANSWTSGSLSLTPTAAGTYYLHLQAINSAGVANVAAVTSAAYNVAAVPEMGTMLSAFGLLAPAALMFRRRRVVRA